MKKIFKDTYKFILFWILQSVYFGLEYLYDIESFKVVGGVVLGSLVLTFILLVFKLIFEVFIVKASSFIFKKEIQVRFILKTLINSMLFPSIICGCFMIYQIVAILAFKINITDYFQIISLMIVGIVYLICSIYNFYKSKHLIAVYTLSIYLLAYMGFQVYNIFLTI